MSSAADRNREKAARLAAGRTPAPVLSDDDERTPNSAYVRPAEPSRSARTDTVKVGVHLAPELHREFTAWCLDAARQLDRGRVNGSDVVRVLLRRLLADEERQAEVVDALRRESRR